MRSPTLCLLALLLAPLAAEAQVRTPSPAHQPEKTLLHFGWSTPGVDFLLDHPEDLGISPFDGISFHLGTGRWLEAISYPGIYDQPLLAFADRPWTAEELRLDELGGIEWGALEGNFVAQMGQSFETLDWFDDDHWATVAANARLVSQAVAASGARGILFDPEYYGFADYNPWRYFPWAYPDRTFEEVEVQVRQRGVEYVQALQSARADMVVLSLWWMGVVYAQTQANGSLEGSGYEFMRAFLNGMLDGARPGLTLVDGNEGTYYVDESWLVSNNYDFLRYEATTLLDPVHRPAWQTEHQVGYAVYADYPLGLDPAYVWGHPEDFQLDWFEHNVYHALLTTDEFVWVYDEEINWWDEPDAGWARYVPPGTEERIASARAKLAAGKGLGFDLAKPGEFWFDPAVAADRIAAPEARLVLPPGPLTLGEPFTVTVEVDGPAQFVSLIVNGAYAAPDDFEAPFEFEVSGLSKGTVTLWARAQTDGYEHVTTAPVRRPVRPSVDVAIRPGTVGEALRVFPNPARSVATAAWGTAEPGRVQLDALGRVVRTLVDEEQPAGTYARRVPLAGVPSGVYLVRLRAGARTETARLTVIH
ncbi:MAG: hypothetical protein AAGI91_06980 [Bacteroidota bacterium]